MKTGRRYRMPDAGWRRAFRWLGSVVGLVVAVGLTRAQEAVPTGAPPLPPPPASPVQFFRDLLAMSPEQQAQALTNRSDKARGVILARLNEYGALAPAERELRLKATHLRWLLLNLMRTAPAHRPGFLEKLPADDRALVADRIRRWEAIPPELQAQFLEHEATIDYFTRVQNSPLPPMPPGLSPELDEQRRRLDSRLALWKTLPPGDRNRMLGQFREFFELGPADLARTVDNLSESQQRLLDTVRDRFSGLTPQQRREAMVSFERLASMSAEQRTRFFRNVQRWEAMSAAERNVWRELTRRVPELPPLPPGMFPTNSIASINR